jgi:hypothetical protein
MISVLQKIGVMLTAIAPPAIIPLYSEILIVARCFLERKAQHLDRESEAFVVWGALQTASSRSCRRRSGSSCSLACHDP